MTEALEARTPEIPDAAPSRRRPLFGVVLALVAAIGVVLVMYRPTVESLTSTLPWNLGDSSLNTWILGWESHALINEPQNFFDGNIYYPYGRAITYSEMILPAVPLFGLVFAISDNAVLAHNAVILGLALFSLIATYFLARRLVGPDAAIVAALGFTFSGYVFMHMGHTQLLAVGFFPLALLALFRTLETLRVKEGAYLGIATALLATACLYYGSIWLLSLSIVVLVDLIRRRRPERAWWAAVGTAALVAGVLLAPFAYVYAKFEQEIGFSRVADESAGLKLLDMVTPAPGSLLYPGLSESMAGRLPGGAVEHGFFLGFTILVLAVGGLVLVLAGHGSGNGARTGAPAGSELPAREVRYLCVVGIVSVVIGIGPALSGIPMPFALLQESVPGFDGIRAVSRLAVPALLTLTVLAALFLHWLLRHRSRAVQITLVVVTSLVVLVEMAVTPIRAEVDTRPETIAIREALLLASAGAVVELPMREVADAGFAFVEGPRMLASVGDWRYRFNGSSSALPPGYLDDILVMNDFPNPEARQRIVERGLRYVVLHGAEVGSDHAYSFEHIAEVLRLLPAEASWERHGDSWLVDLGG
jgi:hypothetical protein